VPAHLETCAGGWKPFFGMELAEKILGIVGLGRIGKAVCRRAQGFGMQVIAHDPFPDQDFASAHQVRFVDLDELLTTADVVSLHAPAEQIEGVLIGAAELAKMKSTALLINTARGQLVDEQALAAALAAGKLGGAGIDAFADEPPTGSALLTSPNVVLTPHIGGRTLDGQRRMGEMAIENCLRALAGEEPLYRVV
jgi:D-3-phosphoglycerate dehydrogenase